VAASVREQFQGLFYMLPLLQTGKMNAVIASFKTALA
jgi:hypothetical protein